MRVFGSGGLVRQSVDLVTNEMEGSFVFVVQNLVGDRDEESMTSMVLVPTAITQFSYVKKLFVGEKTLQVQNETEIVL